jgi:signal transduction histidine kinase
VRARLKLNSLKRKISLSIIVVIFLCAIISAFIINIVVEYQMLGKYGIEKEAAIESLTYSLRPILDSHDYQQLDPVIESSLLFETIASVSVYDGGGTLVHSAMEENTTLEDLEVERHNIIIDQEMVGSFEVGFSRISIDDFIERTTIVLIVALAVFLLLAGVSLYIFMGYSILKPIEVFTRTIRKINSENLSIRLDIQTDDEIGILAASFNQMAGNLEQSHNALKQARGELEEKVEIRTRGERRRVEQLRAINEVSRRISAILSLDELLPYVTNSLQETFNYYNVNIFLFNPDCEIVVLKAGSGEYKGPVPIGFPIGLNEGIVGKVAKTGKLMNVGDVSKEPIYVAVEDLSGTRSELAVPIRIGQETLGVLDVESSDLEAFDEIDLFTVQTLSDQLAIAMENARLYQETRDIAVLEERNRMAREIHDSLVQGFTGVILQLEAAEQAFDDDTDQVQFHLSKARELARESLGDARRSVWALRPQALEQLPLLEAISQQIDLFTQDSGIKVDFSISGNNRTIPANIEDALLRIFQESLTNVKKHAEASRVKVILSFEDSVVGLQVQDNGIGFDTDVPTRSGFGLISMRERAKLIGGSLKVSSNKGTGTQIEVTIPIGKGTE